jgi:Leucine-rich repeat (LRR) protein
MSAAALVLLLLLVTTSSVSASSWTCDVVDGAGRIACETRESGEIVGGESFEGAKSASVLCRNDEDAAEVLTALSKGADSVLERLTLDGCTLLSPLAVQVPVKELDLVDATTLTDGFLSHFPLLASLNASGNGLKIQDLGRNFLCHDGNEDAGIRVDLSGNQIGIAMTCPLGKNSSVSKLDLTRNRISSIGGSAFAGFVHLRELLLANNVIGSLDANALASMPGLQSLDLSGNGLAELPDRLESAPKSLKKFVLADNIVGCFPEDFFSGDLASSLLILDVSNNLVSEECLKSGVLKNLRNLFLLDLSGNKLTSLPDGSLEGLQSIRKLDLSENSISSLGQGVLDGLEKLEDLSLRGNSIGSFDLAELSASAKGLKKLDLGDNAMLTLNASGEVAFSRLEVLKLSKNKLQELDLTAFGSSLKKLSLNHNEVFALTMSGSSEQTLSSLQDLHLRSNRFTKVPEVVRQFPNLKTLDLSLNMIVALDADAFSGLQHLSTLRLEDNSISRLADLVFASAPRLEIVNLSGNLVSNLTARTFEGAANVKALRLDSNDISDVEGIFHAMDRLTWLNVSGNKVSAFDWHFVPYSLKWLDLSSNRISDVRDFYDLRSQLVIQTLDLSHNQLRRIGPASVPDSVAVLGLNVNQIKEIEDDTFVDKTSLRKLDLYANQLANLKESQLRLSPLSNPEIYLGGNPLSCDCNLAWVTEGSMDIKDLDSIYCHSARTSAFVPLVEADPRSDFLCPYREHCFSLCHCCQYDACDCHMTCPDGCRCFHDDAWTVNVVDCGGIKTPPQAIPMDATEVVLSGGSFSILTKRVLIGRRNVQRLYLNNSGLEVVAEEAFVSMETLEVLHLENNLLEKLRDDAFDSQRNLRHLYLQHNRIASLSAEVLRPLRSLEVLRLDHNFLQVLAVWELPNVRVSLINNPWNCSDCRWAEMTSRFVAGPGGGLASGLNDTCLASTADTFCADYEGSDGLTSREVVLAVALSCGIVGLAIVVAIVVFCYRSKENLALVLYTRYEIDKFHQLKSSHARGLWTEAKTTKFRETWSSGFDKMILEI